MTKQSRSKKKKLSPEERQAKREAAIEKLESGVTAITDSEEFKRYLTFLGSFHGYSANNALMIHVQMPEARMVAGYGDWQKKGRQVRKRPEDVKPGEWGITILAPMIGKERDESTGEEQSKVFGFRTATVFDISQTDPIPGADPIPEPPKPGELESGVDTTEFFQHIARTGFGVYGCRMFDSVWRDEFSANPGLKGFYERLNQQAYLRPDLGPIHKVKTALHELVHHVLHKNVKAKDYDRSTFELEAEGTAFVVLQHFGYDTSDYSFPYMANWYEQRDKLKAALAVIRNTAHDLIEHLEAEEEAAA